MGQYYRKTMGLQEYEKEQICRRDVQLLLAQMMKDEEATIKLIIERLLATGSVNFINHKVRITPVNRGLKKIARCANPVGQYVGHRWLVKNTPRMITKWLFSKVKFAPSKPKAQQTVNIKATPTPQALVQTQRHEIKQLKQQVRLTYGVACVAIASLGGVLIWQNSDLLMGRSQANKIQTTETRLLP